MISIRRKLMALQESPSEGLGELTAGYVATLTPSSATEFVITHNMGVIPKIAFVQMVDQTSYNASTAIDETVAINVDITGTGSPLQNFRTCRYYYNNSISTYDSNIGNMLNATETTLTLLPPYSDVRSKWDTSKTYSVVLYG